MGKEDEGDPTKTKAAMALSQRNIEPLHRMPTCFSMMHAEQAVDVANREMHLSHKLAFCVLGAALVLINAIMIGVEVDHGYGDEIADRMLFLIFDMLFCGYFAVEFWICQGYFVYVVRRGTLTAAIGWDYFADPWNVFDFSLLVGACSSLMAYLKGNGSAGIKLVAAVRIIRLLRSVRNLKGLRDFGARELWFIVQGMLDSLSTLAWVGLLLLIIVYCVAVVLTYVVGQDDQVEERWQYAPQYVGTVGRSMWTVIQVMTFDMWATDIARPMQTATPGSVWILLFTVVICSFGVLNVIVAVMVQHTRKLASESSGHVGTLLEDADRQILQKMKEEFRAADGDGNAELTRTEFQDLIHSKRFSYMLRLLGIQVDEAESLFDLMDVNKDGTVSQQEFVMGLQKIKGVAKGQDLVQLISFANRQCLRATRFVERVRKLNEKADVIQERLNNMGRGMQSELHDRRKADDRKNQVWKTAAKRQEVITKLDMDRKVSFPGRGPAPQEYFEKAQAR